MAWNLRYVFSRKFRFNKEFAAVKPQKVYLGEHGETYDDEHKAKMLSGRLYFWIASYKEALDKLKQL